MKANNNVELKQTIFLVDFFLNEDIVALSFSDL